MTVPESSPRDRDSAPRERSGKGSRTRRRKRWYEQTSVTLCVAAACAIVGLGFVHVIVGVTNSYGLSFDVVLRESFGYREIIVDVRKIESLPYTAAKLKHPLGVAALRRSGYLPDDPWFEAATIARQREHLDRWRREFEISLGRSAACPLDGLRGQEQVAGLDPQDAGACNQRGVAFAQEGQYQAALAEFARTIRRDPTFADAFYNRAMVSLQIGNVGQAASDLGTFVEIKPGFVEGHVRRGRLFVAMNEHDKAFAAFTRAIEIDPKCVEALFHHSLVHFVRGDFDKALADVRTIQCLGLSVPAELSEALQGTAGANRIELSAIPDY